MDRFITKAQTLEFLKKYRFVLLVLSIGLLLMWLPESGPTKEIQETSPAPDGASLSLEQRLTEILSQIEGAGKVRVMLTERSGAHYTYQTDEDMTDTNDSTTVRRDTVIITDANRTQQGLLQRVDPPKYQGALIVCQGADRPSVRLAIVQAVSNVTGLGADKISVQKMK